MLEVIISLILWSFSSLVMAMGLGPIGNPKTWVPYMNTKDCSQGICSFYCPQWCYNFLIFPPPPPPIEFPDDDDSGPNFSPLAIAIIGILVSAFLLVSYYTIISKYCVNMGSTRRRENHESGEVLEDDHNPSTHEPWQISTTGLDEALIRSITVCKYKKGDGLVDGTDCSVCLSEFQEDESLRLLPKCSHAFHVHCIDRWLRSHSNCPLCRANIIFISASPLPLPAPVTESTPGNEFLQDRRLTTSENVAAAQDSGRSLQEMGRVQSDLGGFPKTPSRAFSDLGNAQGRRTTVIEIREEDYQQMRRSVSMDHLCQTQLSVADILHANQEEDTSVEECHFSPALVAGSSKQSAEASKHSNKMRVLHCVMNPVAMKRSLSSGRFFLTRQGRVRNP